MKKELISFDPQIIQFVSDRMQLVKVTNLTQQAIDNCFFCMYNTQRYQFNPNYFSLQPHEQKLITVNFLGKLSPKQIKQFAYLKSSHLSKRITLINGPSTVSAQKFRSPQSGIQQIYTLSSRDYRETQITAYQKIIADKQAYIQRLQRLNEELKDSSNRKSIRQHSQPSSDKTKHFYLNQIEALELKVNLLNKEKDQLIRENILMQQRFNQYKSMSTNDSKYQQINDLLMQKNQLITRQNQQVQFLQKQCQQFLARLSDKQTQFQQMQKIKDLEIKQMVNNNETLLQKLQQQIAKSKQSNIKASRVYQQRVKQLEQSVAESRIDRQKMQQLQIQIQKKKKQLDKVIKQLKQQQQQRLIVEQQKSRSKEIQKSFKNLQKEKFQLTSRVNKLIEQLGQIKQQNSLYRSKIQEQDQSKSKMGHYLQVALESCKNQNLILKTSKVSLQKNINQNIKLQKAQQNKIQSLQRKFKQISADLEDMRVQKEEIQSRSRTTKQEMHEALMKLKTQNIDLIEKINVCSQDKVSQSKFLQLKKEIQQKEKQLQIKSQKLQKAQQQNDKLLRRVDKVRKETKKQIKSLQDDTLGQLKKVKDQKLKLSKKVAELEESVVNSETYDLSRAKTKTHYDTPHNAANTNTRTRCPRSQGEKKLGGIKNQRKQLEESRSSSNQHQIDLEGLYSELGQLRQFKSYANNQLEKLAKIMGISNSQKQNSNHQQSRASIFATINFFEEIKSIIAQKSTGGDKIVEIEKQKQFLKGRISQLQNIHKENREYQNRQFASSIQIEKYEGSQQLLQYVRRQMKTQYAKQYDAIKLGEQKFSLLKRKIYEEYRSRIVGVLAKNKKDQALFPKIQVILERFIDGLANLSHKEAVLAKQIKLKISARKQVDSLRGKIKNLTQLLEMKKGYCTRDSVNVFNCDNQAQWHDNIKLEAKILTIQSQMSKLKEELDLSKTNGNYLQQELKVNLTQLQFRQEEVLRLKKQILKISKQNQRQLTRRQQQIDNIQKKYINSNSNDLQRKKSQQNSYKQSQFQAMKEELRRKKQLISNLKDKQKMLQSLLQSTQRNQSQNRERERRQTIEEQRKESALRDFKDSNRELRSQNNRLHDKLARMEEQLQQKNLSLKRLRGQGQQNRIKSVKTQDSVIEKLRQQMRELKEQLKKVRQNSQKLKKRKQKQVEELEADLKRVRNEHLIQLRSFESIIRALVDTMHRIYTAIDIIIRKKGVKPIQTPDFDELINSPGQIDSLKVYESFEKLIDLLKK